MYYSRRSRVNPGYVFSFSIEFLIKMRLKEDIR